MARLAKFKWSLLVLVTVAVLGACVCTTGVAARRSNSNANANTNANTNANANTAGNSGGNGGTSAGKNKNGQKRTKKRSKNKGKNAPAPAPTPTPKPKPAAGWKPASNRPPTDIFLLLVAVLIGMSIGLALPFFLELARCDLAAYDALASGGPHNNDPKTQYKQEMVDDVTARDSVTVNGLGNRQFEIHITKNTTCGDVVKELQPMLDLSNGGNEYGLFVRCNHLNGPGAGPAQYDSTDLTTRTPNTGPGAVCVCVPWEGVDVRLDEKLLVHTAMLQVHHQLAALIAEKDKDRPKGAPPGPAVDLTQQYQFVFNIFVHSEYPDEASYAEKDFQFESAFDATMRRRIPLGNTDLIKLSALRLQCLLGDADDNASFPDSIKVHPMQEDGLYTPLDPTAPDGSSRPVAKTTKKRIGRGGKTSSTPSAARRLSVDDVSLVQAAIVKEWHQALGMATDEARIAFMDTIREWKYYRCAIFNVKQTQNREWPEEVWVTVGHRGVSLHERNNRVPLGDYPYSNIHSFGAPVAMKYKIEVEGVAGGSIEFITKHVQEVARLMKIHIGNVTTSENREKLD